ncbi:hypothetical protein LCGC14_1038780 [marine sediment metagenome]|uniref:Uncharacterized protein n=1 Tax=marine sediment metagenome TaxID=412755 RepID=A0A0F9NE26_9ZZZZ
MKTENWYSIRVCIKCGVRLKDRRRMYADGTCYICGYHVDSTVCATNTVILRETRHHNWWEFWKRKFTHEGRNSFSKNWLTKHTMNRKQ